MIKTSDIDNHHSSQAAINFVKQISLYDFANPENIDGDTVSIIQVRKLMQYAYDQGSKKRKGESASGRWVIPSKG